MKLLGKLVTPLINKVATSAAKMQADVEETLAKARLLMLNNKELESILGQPLTTSMPMTTGVHSVNINGKAVAQVTMQFQVMGNSNRVGTATMVTKVRMERRSARRKRTLKWAKIPTQPEWLLPLSPPSPEQRN